MEEKEILSKFKSELYGILKSCYDLTVSQKKQHSEMSKSNKSSSELGSLNVLIQQNTRKYNDYTEIYNKVNKSTSLSEISQIRSFLLVSMKECKDINERERKEFSGLQVKGVSFEELQKKAASMKVAVERYGYLKEILVMIDKYLSISQSKEKVSGTSPINKPLPQTSQREVSKSPVPKKEEPVRTTKVNKNEYVKDTDILAVGAISKKICELKNELFSLPEEKEKEAKQLRVTIYNLCQKRQDVVFRLSGFEGVNVLESIDSEEDAVYSKSEFTPEAPYTMDASEYNKRLNSTLLKINDLQFNVQESKYFKNSLGKKQNGTYREFRDYYDTTMRRYNNMIVSLFGRNPEVLSMSRDLISSFGSFNLEGGYSAFKSKHSDGMIGSENVNQEMYKEGIDKINGLMGKLSSYSTQMIGKSGGSVKVVNHEKTKAEKIAMLNQRYFEVYNLIINNKNSSMSRA